jgi:pyruvate kinase
MLSFVRRGAEVRSLRRVLAAAGRPELPVLAKIERLEACERLDEILAEAAAGVVARGDLGVDAGPERVPALQRRIFEACRAAGKPVLLATELLESMTRRARPTRAEVSDVATAVLDGVDAVMLSGETAVGAHPALVVETMNRVLMEAEKEPGRVRAGGWRGEPVAAPDADGSVALAAVLLAAASRARAIAVYTRSGASAVRLSTLRPSVEVRAFVPEVGVLRRLAMCFGVRGELCPPQRGAEAAAAAVARRLAATPGWRRGDRAVLVMGAPDDPAGATSVVRLLAP